ncbi:hypothetical protein ACOMICROBIO_GDFFDHBD_02354 [Vibrio sp. B1REV9]|nr:hypothetical protein ACOMICROBIO_GDFFDHBD_02354 [Vibrio sp. B1REV9]
MSVYERAAMVNGIVKAFVGFMLMITKLFSFFSHS